MYNLNNHYDNIWQVALQRFANPRIDYFMPFGATGTENLEGKHVNLGNVDCTILCYDQEPLIKLFNADTFLEIQNRAWSDGIKWSILLNTELDSDPKDDFLKRFRFIDCYYFHHGLAAADWFRGGQWWVNIKSVADRNIEHKFITFNRLTSGDRVYRSLLINELYKHQKLDQGLISYSQDCPMGDNFDREIFRSKHIPDALKLEAVSNLRKLDHNLRIDIQGDIPNQSFNISCIDECNSTFLYVVTETCFWGRKKHLTEKIFKPIVTLNPFLLVGCAHNLEYLRSYGFKTFGKWIDESYDTIEDDIERLTQIGNEINRISNLSLYELKLMYYDMKDVLEHNRNWFYSTDFIRNVYSELVVNFNKACDEFERRTSLESQRL